MTNFTENTFHHSFICFAAEDRYTIAEPIVYHLKNYGIQTWYDRHTMVLGDNRIEKNLNEGASHCKYAIPILSKYTIASPCAMEELSIIKNRYYQNDVTVFPVLYELSPNEIPVPLYWIKELIFKEVDRSSGTREVCNHIACKITGDILHNYSYSNIQTILDASPSALPSATQKLLYNYQRIDCANLNSRVSLLYAVYLIIYNTGLYPLNPDTNMVSKIFDRLFTETRLNLEIDYREIWLLENSICILISYYLESCTESKISTISSDIL